MLAKTSKAGGELTTRYARSISHEFRSDSYRRFSLFSHCITPGNVYVGSRSSIPPPIVIDEGPDVLPFPLPLPLPLPFGSEAGFAFIGFMFCPRLTGKKIFCLFPGAELFAIEEGKDDDESPGAGWFLIQMQAKQVVKLSKHKVRNALQGDASSR